MHAPTQPPVPPAAPPAGPGSVDIETAAGAAPAPWCIRPRGDQPFSSQRPHLLSHTYSGHPLLDLPRLQRLAGDLHDKGHCRFLLPGARQDSPFDAARRSPDGRGVEDVFQQIETPASWIALYNVEHDAEYREFLWDVIRGVQPLLGAREKVLDVQGFIFVSAPPSVTPFHIDRENNFWLQIRGSKTIRLWDAADRSVVPGAAVESFILYRGLEGVTLSESGQTAASDHDCGPGDGVYFPSTTPHATRSDVGWVTPGDGVAISIGINFYTNRTRRAAHVHQWNHALRRCGLRPCHPGVSAWRDILKYPFGWALTALRRRLRGYQPPPGF